MNAKKLTGIALATAAAGLFATATNACKGQNGCKGKGMLMMSAKDCKTKGGKYEMPKGS